MLSTSPSYLGTYPSSQGVPVHGPDSGTSYKRAHRPSKVFMAASSCGMAERPGPQTYRNERIPALETAHSHPPSSHYPGYRGGKPHALLLSPTKIAPAARY